VEYGWTGDFCEISEFVAEVYAHAGVTISEADLYAEVDAKSAERRA
jgi:hypothetical protein